MGDIPNEEELVQDAPGAVAGEDSLFDHVFNLFSGEEDGEAAGEDAPEDGATEDAPATVVAGGEAPAAGAGSDTGAAAGGDGGDAGAGGTGEAAGAAAPAPAPVEGWTADSSTFTDGLNSLPAALEERYVQRAREEVFSEVQEEYQSYFEILNKHPRRLVGMQVPDVSESAADGASITLRDSKDAAEWQDAVKSLLTEEISSRADTILDSQQGEIVMVRDSIKLFQDNKDLIPYTKGFDRELADRFAATVKGYEVRGENGKLRGYAVPVQPLINQLRTTIHAERKASPASTTAPVKKAAAKPPARGPQGAIRSRSASTTDGAEDYSALFGTLGNSGFRL